MFTSYRWLWDFEGWLFSNIAFVSLIGKSIKALYSFSFSFPYPLPMNNAEPSDRCHEYCAQHCTSFRTQANPAHSCPFLLLPPRFASFSYSHTILTHVLKDAFLQHTGVKSKILLLSLGPPMGITDPMPGTGMLACVFPLPRASPAKQRLPCRPYQPLWLQGQERTHWAIHWDAHALALVSWPTGSSLPLSLVSGVLFSKPVSISDKQTWVTLQKEIWLMNQIAHFLLQRTF